MRVMGFTDGLWRGRPLKRLLAWLVVASGFLFLGVVGSGLWLGFRYLPGSSVARVVRYVHGGLSYLLVAALVGVAAISAVLAGRSVSRRRWLVPVGAVGLLAVLVVALISGFALAWDQLALFAVTGHGPGDLHGVFHAAFDDQVGFLLFGHSEVTQSSYRGSLWIHIAIAPILAMALTLGLWRVSARRVASVPSSPDTNSPPVREK